MVCLAHLATPDRVLSLTCYSHRKNVIIAAYSNAHPQTAAAWSANITSWGMSLVPICHHYFAVIANTVRLWKHVYERALLHRHEAKPRWCPHLWCSAPKPLRQLQATGGDIGQVCRRNKRQPESRRVCWRLGRWSGIQQCLRPQRWHATAQEHESVRDGRFNRELRYLSCAGNCVDLGALHDTPEGWRR